MSDSCDCFERLGSSNFSARATQSVSYCGLLYSHLRSGTYREKTRYVGLYTPFMNLNLIFLPLQALPYVCLLIAMLFFIYAIIGMQVRDQNSNPPFIFSNILLEVQI